MKLEDIGLVRKNKLFHVLVVGGMALASACGNSGSDDAAVDTGTVSDTGSGSDSGNPSDTGTSDSGTASDTGTATDSGNPMDTGVVVDAALVDTGADVCLNMPGSCGHGLCSW